MAVAIIIVIYMIYRYRADTKKEGLDPVAPAPKADATANVTVKKNDYSGMPINDKISDENDFVVYNNKILVSEEDPELIIPGLTADNCLQSCRDNDNCRMAVIYDQKDACRGTQKSCRLYDFAQSPGHVIFANDPKGIKNEVIPDHTLSRQGTQTYSVSDTIICRQLAGNNPTTFFVDEFDRQFCSVKKGSRALGDTYIKRQA